MYTEPAKPKYGTAVACTPGRNGKQFRVLLQLAPAPRLHGKLDPAVVCEHTTMLDEMVLAYGNECMALFEANSPTFPETARIACPAEFSHWNSGSFSQMPVRVPEYDRLMMHAIIDINSGTLLTAISPYLWPLDLVWSPPALLTMTAKGDKALRQLHTIRDTYAIMRS